MKAYFSTLKNNSETNISAHDTETAVTRYLL